MLSLHGVVLKYDHSTRDHHLQIWGLVFKCGLGFSHRASPVTTSLIIRDSGGLDLGKPIPLDHEICRMSPSNQSVNKDQYKGLFFADVEILCALTHTTISNVSQWLHSHRSNGDTGWNSTQHHCLTGDFTRNNIEWTT